MRRIVFVDTLHSAAISCGVKCLSVDTSVAISKLFANCLLATLPLDCTNPRHKNDPPENEKPYFDIGSDYSVVRLWVTLEVNSRI